MRTGDYARRHPPIVAALVRELGGWRRLGRTDEHAFESFEKPKFIRRHVELSMNPRALADAQRPNPMLPRPKSVAQLFHESDQRQDGHAADRESEGSRALPPAANQERGSSLDRASVPGARKSNAEDVGSNPALAASSKASNPLPSESETRQCRDAVQREVRQRTERAKPPKGYEGADLEERKRAEKERLAAMTGDGNG